MIPVAELEAAADFEATAEVEARAGAGAGIRATAMMDGCWGSC